MRLRPVDTSPQPSSTTQRQQQQQQQAYPPTPSGKAHRMFCEVVLPLADSPNLPSRTSFVFTEEDILANTLARIDRKCPHLYRDRDRFMRVVEEVVYGMGQSPSTPISPAPSSSCSVATTTVGGGGGMLT